ncbi:hypothetical protein [Coraliomargarita parva]|uniref:hypothetical protein n=1 Tax=Coraliomargarita parva TaxID=3014050 RepID=UPI0022B37F71|nr:hypothetical protein [Coraliomargarita parva]
MVAFYKGTAFRQDERQYPFYVAEKEWNDATSRYDYYRKGMEGVELPSKGDHRRYIISENQADYPEPESACGPTALLNLYIWYTKFGLIEENIRHSDEQRYKLLKFEEIDQHLLELQRMTRSHKGGTNSLEQVVTLDELVQAHSPQGIRIHFEIKDPPLTNHDFLKVSRNYRAGFLYVRPEDPKSGQLLDYHVVLIVRADTSGTLTLANWGKFQHGRLSNRQDGQWFIPSEPDYAPLRIESLTTIIPFTPDS